LFTDPFYSKRVKDGETFLLLTRIAATESVSLCKLMEKLPFWNSNLRSALAANSLDKLARFFQAFRIMKTRIPLLLITFALVCFTSFQNTQAVSPPPDGGYAGDNTAEGEDALLNLSTGRYNTAVGFAALFSNTTSNFNTAIGTATLLANTGEENTATGAGALLFNTTGRENTAIGAFALIENRDGFDNTAVGDRALESNTSGISNIAIGALAMQANTSSLFSVAVGVGALMANQTTGNTAVGHLTLSSNTTGSENTAVGYQAGMNLTTGDSNIDIGNAGVAGESNTIRIGTQGVQTGAFIAGISGTTLPNGAAVVIDTATGQLGVTTSS
jgi:hypothetical protein